MNENISNHEEQQEQHESTKEMASKKFDEIFSTICKNDCSIRIRKDGKNGGLPITGYIRNNAEKYQNPLDGREHYTKTITIKWYGYPVTEYSLTKDEGSYSLKITQLFQREEGRHSGLPIKDDQVYYFTPQEVLDNILPNFEKRLKEAQQYMKNKRLNDIKMTNQFAELQDKNDAENKIDDFLAA